MVQVGAKKPRRIVEKWSVKKLVNTEATETQVRFFLLLDTLPYPRFTVEPAATEQGVPEMKKAA